MWVFPHHVWEEGSVILIEITTLVHRAGHRLRSAHLQRSNFRTMIKQQIVRNDVEVFYLLVYFYL